MSYPTQNCTLYYVGTLVRFVQNRIKNNFAISCYVSVSNQVGGEDAKTYKNYLEINSHLSSMCKLFII